MKRVVLGVVLLLGLLSVQLVMGHGLAASEPNLVAENTEPPIGG